MSETGQIRRARRTDARAIAQIQVETWRSAYAGILQTYQSGEVMTKEDPEEKEEFENEK